ncbi:hypothetical protein CSIM01_01290 [Colletotrichum simmondsii]|uniref:DH domain-containing protein n=1 Tax=Colletotrichum simmondsii TaxID=703756 RepID=A0A135TAF4_9PEZI|nr:hypothetical protein CSIM01_01290 [Colletotrichum simmondsii]
MVRVTEELTLSAEQLTLYHASDPLLGHLPVLIFHGASTTANYTLNSSRVQIHVYSPAGYQSFPRLTIQPNSPFYAVVNHLPREWQGDEIYRGLAFGLYKYFQELPEVVKNHLKNTYPTTRGRRPGSGPALFGEQHAADLAKNMIKSENTVEVLETLQTALQTQHLSNVDVDFVLPPGSIVPLQPEDLDDAPEDDDEFLDPTLRQYGGYTSLVKLLGEPLFLPTSRLRRAPSKPTSLNRSKSFSKDQKVDLRMKLGELVDTEERYVLKLNELVKHIADDFRQSAKQRDPSSLSPSEEELEKLFPRSADRILQVNSAFMEDLRKIMDDTEEEAVRDMEVTTVALTGSRLGSPSKMKDPTGALAIARVFLEWFPKFTDCYQEYIRASQHFPTLLNSFLDQQSSFRQRVLQTGEQTVRSILIEPVQRLPRYSLLIDQIVSCLPMTHPALQSMLKARDIITNICSMDEPIPDKPQVTNRLRNMVESWPLDLEPQGRLILAADFVELPAPYRVLDPPEAAERAGIFVLFSDCLVILKKLGPKPMTGKDLLREIDKPSAAGLLLSMTNAAGGQPSYELAFTGWHNLADVRFTESTDGKLIWMTSTQEMKGAHAGEWVTGTAVTSRCFLLEETFTRASKWTEDIVKARVEGRFSEKEREDPSWTLRSIRMSDNNLGFFAAVFQEGADQLIDGRREPAPIRIVIDHEKGTKGAPIGHYGVEITVNVNSGDLKKVKMVTAGLNGKQFTDDVALDDFLPTLTRRIIQLLGTQFSVSNMRLAPALVSYYTKILKGLPLMTRAEKTRSFLASSPVKGLFSSIWGGSTNTEAHSPPKHSRTPVTNVFPPPVSRANSEAGSIYGSARGKDGIKMGGDDRPENPLVRLEQTFTGYVASLQARKGNFADFVNFIFKEMAPQNQRAFTALIKLLADLLDGCGNDGDRGILTVSFAELLVSDGTAQAYINLLDRLVEDCDRIFDDAGFGVNLTVQQAFESMNSRSGKSHSGSLTSNTSSIRRKFGFDTLLRQNSKNDSERPSVWRTLSKHGRHPASADAASSSSLSKMTSSRARSIDSGTQPGPNKLRRPGSRDRPPIAGAFDELPRPSSSQRPDMRLETIGEPDVESTPPVKSSKKKRRSSLSDLRSLMEAATITDPREKIEEAMMPLRINKQTSEKFNSTPRIPSPSRIPISPTSQSLRSPRMISPRQKENPMSPEALFSSPPAPPDRENTPSRTPKGHARGLSTSNIPTLRPTRPIGPVSQSTDSIPRPSTSPGKPPGSGKLRLQSPQKLRERLQTEKKAVEDVDASLQSELSKIAEEMSRVNSGLGGRTNTLDLRKLTASVKTLEERIPTMMSELTDRQTAIQRDMESTLRASETKVKSIDQLYRESTAENELMYEKFNSELGKIVKALKGKGREDKEELIRSLREHSEETARVKKENARLKREIVSLRTVMKGAD